MDGQERYFSNIFRDIDEKKEVKNVNSSSYEPISVGARKNRVNQQPKQARASQDAQGQNPNKNKAHKASSKAGSGSGTQQTDKKNASSSQKKNNSSGNKQQGSQQSRTPKGKDTRYSGNEDYIQKKNENYEAQRKKGKSHDELSKKRKKSLAGRIKWKNVSIVALVFLFGVVGIGLFCYSLGSPINEVKIDGYSKYTVERVMEVANIRKGDSKLALNEKLVKQSIVSQLAYIKDVQIGFNSDTGVLTLKLEPTADKYVITSANQWITLDPDGKVLTTDKQNVREGMYQVDGFSEQSFSVGDIYKPFGDNEMRYDIMEEIVALFDKNELIKTAVINVQDLSKVYVRYDDRITILLGDCSSLKRKIINSVYMITNEIDKNERGTINMTVDADGHFIPETNKAVADTTAAQTQKQNG